MHVFSKRSFLCRHTAGIGSIFLTGFLTGICSKFLSEFLPKFLVHIPGRIAANLNISLQIPQGVHTDSCRNPYKKNQIVKGIPARNLVSFSCGNTAVFLLDNFVRVQSTIFHYYKTGHVFWILDGYKSVVQQTHPSTYVLEAGFELQPFYRAKLHVQVHVCQHNGNEFGLNIWHRVTCTNCI